MQEKMLEAVIGKEYANMGAICVTVNDKVEYENYFNGCRKDSSFHIFSVTKSIMATLIGIAIDQGAIKSVDEKLITFFPEMKRVKANSRINTITLKDLLTMRIAYKQIEFETFFGKNDWAKAAIHAMDLTKNLDSFYYAPLIGPDILSKILSIATKKNVLSYANEYLFSPLGIKVEHSICFQSKEEQLMWYQMKNPKGWVCDKEGTYTAGWGLNLTVADLAKIGRLYLKKGIWNQRQVVSSQWLHEVKKQQNFCAEWNLSYGYLWWIIDEKEHIYAAMGDGGNTLYINEKKNLVVAIASFLDPAAKDRIDFIKRYIEPYV